MTLALTWLRTPRLRIRWLGLCSLVTFFQLVGIWTDYPSHADTGCQVDSEFSYEDDSYRYSTRANVSCEPKADFRKISLFGQIERCNSLGCEQDTDSATCRYPTCGLDLRLPHSYLDASNYRGAFRLENVKGRTVARWWFDHTCLTHLGCIHGSEGGHWSSTDPKQGETR